MIENFIVLSVISVTSIPCYYITPFEIKQGDIEFHFYNNLPNNVTADLEYAELVDRGMMSKETAFKRMETITDVEGELKRIEAEQRQRVVDAIRDIAKEENPNPAYEFTM